MNSTLKLLFLSSCIALSVSFSGFGQTSNVAAGCSPLQVNFTAPSGSSTFYWDFKDGVTSNLQNPNNIFAQAGTYNVEFKESVSGPVIGTVQITVYPEPQLRIIGATGCTPFHAALQDNSIIDPAIHVNTYVWVFGDGQSSTGPENVFHDYVTLGKFSVSFSVQTNYPSCDRTLIFSDVVEVIAQPSPIIATTPNPPNTCANSLNVSFINNSTGDRPMSYSWDMGNGATSTAVTPPSQTYGLGQHTVNLQAIYTGMTGCLATTSQSINVGSPVANIITKKDTLCINALAVPFYTHTSGTYHWDFGPHAVLDTNLLNSDSLTVSFNQGGVQNVSLTVTSLDGQCSNTKTIPIYVDDVKAIATHTPQFTCSSPVTVQYTGSSNQSNVSYLWSFAATGDSVYTANTTKTFSSNSSDYFGYNTLETLSAELTVTSNVTGCKGYDNGDSDMWLPNALFMPDISEGCHSLTVNFSDSSISAPVNPIVSETWLFGDGTTQTLPYSVIPGFKIPVPHTYNTPGEYMVRLIVTTQMGCVDTSYAVLIQVGDDLTSQINFTADKSAVCPGEAVEFTAQVTPAAAALIDGYHFSSEGNRVFHCADQTAVSWSYTNLAGPQDVSLTVDYNGCLTTVTKSAFVNVKGAVAKIDYAAACNQPMDYKFRSQSMGATTLAWNFGDTQTSAATAITHSYAATGDYSVTLTASDPGSGCAATQDNALIHVRKIKARMTMDTLLCGGNLHTYNFNATASTDVYSNCYTGYTWQFTGADGHSHVDIRPYTSTSSVGSFTFPDGGHYMVKLIVKDINGCTDTTSQHFNVYNLNASYSWDNPQICVPRTQHFTNLTQHDTTIVSYVWQFGDTSVASSTVSDPTIIYKSPAPNGSSYDVYLTVTDAIGCSSQFYQPLSYYKPTTTITSSDNTLCTTDPFTLTATDFTAGGSHLTYNWDLGNGQTSTSATPSLAYTNAQTYHVKLNYAEISSGCKDSTLLDLTVHGKPIAKIGTNINLNAVLCADANVFYTDSSISVDPITGYYWDFGTGPPTGAAGGAAFYHKGTYTVVHIVVTNNGCLDSAQTTFRVYKPEGSFDIDKNTICKDDQIMFSLGHHPDTADVGSFTWGFGDGITLNNVSPVSHTYNFHPVSGFTVAKLVLRGANGICPVEQEDTIFIRQVIADFDRGIAGDTSLCFNDGPYPFKNTSIAADSYNWNFNDMTFDTSKDPTHQFPSPGVFNVTLSITNTATGCVDTITKPAVLYANPTPHANGDTLCQGTPFLNFGVTNPVATSHYLWTPSTGLSDPTIANPTATINESIIYEVTETDTNNCATQIAVPAVVVGPLPLHDVDTTIVIGDQVTLPIYGVNSLYYLNWTPTTDLSCLHCNFPTIRPLTDVLYTLVVTDSLHCDSVGYTFKITVKPDTFVKMPTAFTPNGDGTNDIVYVEGWGIKQLLEFTIFNRWGQQIYASSDLTEGWNGTFDGILQNSDIYVYKVKVLTWRNEEVRQEGHINLLH
ncbi:MAG: large protein [Chitinophagaceae bacterium]|nr:large protein [Chitinophagaceae bacterium]